MPPLSTSAIAISTLLLCLSAACAAGDDVGSDEGNFTGGAGSAVAQGEIQRIQAAWDADDDATHLVPKQLAAANDPMAVPQAEMKNALPKASIDLFVWKAQLKNPDEKVDYSLVEATTDKGTGAATIAFYRLPSGATPKHIAVCTTKSGAGLKCTAPPTVPPECEKPAGPPDCTMFSGGSQTELTLDNTTASLKAKLPDLFITGADFEVSLFNLRGDWSILDGELKRTVGPSASHGVVRSLATWDRLSIDHDVLHFMNSSRDDEVVVVCDAKRPASCPKPVFPSAPPPDCTLFVGAQEAHLTVDASGDLAATLPDANTGGTWEMSVFSRAEDKSFSVMEAALMLNSGGFSRPTARALATSSQLKVDGKVLTFVNRGPEDQVTLRCKPN